MGISLTESTRGKYCEAAGAMAEAKMAKVEVFISMEEGCFQAPSNRKGWKRSEQPTGRESSEKRPTLYLSVGRASVGNPRVADIVDRTRRETRRSTKSA